MDGSVGFFDQKPTKALDKSKVHSDMDGNFDCTLIKDDHDSQLPLDQIQLTIIREQSKYNFLLIKMDDEPLVDLSDSNIATVKSRFYSTFYDLTGNFWQLRERFIKIPGRHYLPSNDLDSLPSSEEQQICRNRINKIPKFMNNERAFFNDQSNSIEETYPFIHDGLNFQVVLPNIFDKEILSSLLATRHLVVRIAVFYERKSTTEMILGSGFLLTNKLILTCAHIFDPILWSDENISYSKILVGFSDPASETLFSLVNPNPTVVQAKIVQRGLLQDNMDDYTETKVDHTDLALLSLDGETKYIGNGHYLDPKLGSVSRTTGDIPVNSTLYLVGYNGELIEQEDLEPYKYLKGFNALTIDKLNLNHHVNHKSISIGHLVKEASENEKYTLHNCSTLPGSSGSIIIDCYGRLAGVHIGMNNSRKKKKDSIFFNNETFNKYVSINSTQFQTFIREAILTNIEDDQLLKKWVI